MRDKKSQKMLKCYLDTLKEFTNNGLELADIVQKITKTEMMKYMIEASRIADSLNANYYDFLEAQFRILMGWKSKVIPMPWHLASEKSRKRYVMFMVDKQKIRERMKSNKDKLWKKLKSAGFSDKEIRKRYSDIF